MKNKMRKVSVKENVYFYKVISGHCDDDRAIAILEIYLEGYRHTPYVINFHCRGDFYGGTSLSEGVLLFNTQTHLTELVNLHRPYFVRLCILKALEEEWDASTRQVNDFGMQFLTELNLDIAPITPKALQHK